MRFGMFQHSLHHRDLVSKRSNSNILGGVIWNAVWHVSVQPPPWRSCFRTLKLQHLGGVIWHAFWHVPCHPPPSRSCFRTLTLQHLGGLNWHAFWYVSCQPPPWSCFRTLKLQHSVKCCPTYALACPLSISTTEIRFPNAQAPTSWGCVLA